MEACIGRSGLDGISWLLSDLAVDPEYQGPGVGNRLVQLLRDKLGGDVAYVRLSAPGAVAFYPKIGFDRADKAFVIRRKR